MDIKGYIKTLLRERHFSTTLPEPEKKSHLKTYEGRDIIWYGDPEQMIVVHKNDVEGMWGNIYDPDKMEYVVELIGSSEDKVEFECPYAHGDVVGLTDVEEEQMSYMQDHFEIDYDGKEEPATTGDEELDTYIGAEDLQETDIVEFERMDNPGLVKLLNQYKLTIARGRYSREDLIKAIKDFKAKDDEGFTESDEEGIDAFFEYEDAVKEAVDNNYGDLGEFHVQLRDGHHRVMGAIKAGEERVAVNLEKDDIKRFEGYYNKV